MAYTWKYQLEDGTLVDDVIIHPSMLKPCAKSVADQNLVLHKPIAQIAEDEGLTKAHVKWLIKYYRLNCMAVK